MALIDDLAAWNPWWQDGRMPEALAGRPRTLAARLTQDLQGPHAVVLTGIRRSGKTTFMHQMADRLLQQGIDPHRILYINLEDLALDGMGIEEIAATHRRDLAPDPPRYLLLDEVQTRPEWARFVRVLIDQKKDRVAVTGSTSSLLMGDAGPLLTGRHLSTQVRPLDFTGVLAIHGVEPPGPAVAPQDADAFTHHLDRFLRLGGFPRPNLEDPHTARRTLQHYFRDILHRDIVVRHGLDPHKVERLGVYLAKTFARPHSKSALQRATGLSREAIRHYLDALSSSYLMQPCTRFTWSPKPEVIEQAPLKYYLADPGLRNAVTASGSDIGRLAENAVANALQAEGHPLQYWNSARHEVDFVVARPDGRIDAIQVTYGDEVPDREVAALQAFHDGLPARLRGSLLLLTRVPVDVAVPSLPLWKWFTATKEGG